MPDEDVITPDGGQEPAVEPASDASVAAEAPEAAPAAPSFAVEDIAAGLGARFQERFLAHHEPAAAISEYGKSVEHLQSAYGRLSQGGEPTDEDRAHAEALGVELPTYEEPEEEPTPLWGAPWLEPTDYASFTEMVERNPRGAMEFIDKQPEGVIDPDVRQQVLAYWASPEHANDYAGALAYEKQQAETRAFDKAKSYADERYADLEQRLTPFQERAAASDQQARFAMIDALALRARTTIPGFEDYEEGVVAIVKQNAAQDPTYIEKLLACTPEEQLQHINDVTGTAAWRNRPAAQAEATAEAEAAVEQKVKAGSERGSGAAGSTSGSSSKSAAKKQFTAEITAALKSPV